MLNRRILRVKIFKVLYSRYICPELSLEDARRQLNLSLEASRTLYCFILSMVTPLTAVAAERIEELKKLSTADKSAIDPNKKFADNLLSKLLESDPDFKKIVSKYNFPSWSNYDLFLKKLYSDILTRDYYKEYITSGKSSFAEDCALFAKIFQIEFEDRDEFLEILETTTLERKNADDEALYWNDDAFYCLAFASKMLSKRNFRFDLPPIFASDMKPGKQSDKDFTFKVLESGFIHFDEYRELVMNLLPETRFHDKVNSIDICLCITALAEMKAFYPEIPSKVSINEYLEISKYFGSEQSTSFINGLLSNAVKSLDIQL
ncbi:MAG: hypothetical protein HUJ95_05330 [Bacteroidales bacterium]|nr:hypothetical protein [Bacteroidales bacterium]